MEEEVLTCYGPGSIAGAIVGTLLITLALAAAALLIYNIYWRSRKGKHLVLVSDVENPDDHFAFDNPNFREATPIKQSLVEDTKSSKLDLSWLGNWSPLHAFSTPKHEKPHSLDDSHISGSQLKVVSLKSHDFTGLGFSVCGNMRDGIYVKDLLHRGPAFESGCINPGDRIDSICISFRHMVFEDALTILSYASPYDVQVQVEHNGTSRPATLLRKREANGGVMGDRIFLHPFHRSQSISDLNTIHKSSEKKTSEKGINQESAASEYPTLKLSSSAVQTRKENQQLLERRSADVVDSADHPKHAKFGVRVLPAIGLNNRTHKDNTEYEQNAVTEQTAPKTKDDDVKTLITKGLHNLKEKINQNTLGRKKKEEECENEEMAPGPANLNIQEEFPIQIPLEVARAGAIAQDNRKSISAESLAARRPTSEFIIELTSAPVEDETPQKKSKGKAPAPPQIVKSSNEDTPSKALCNVQPGDSDSDTESVEMTCTQVTVHHSPPPEETEQNRKATSLGDLSRIDDDKFSGPLERATSLDLDGPHGKKRKAPLPPSEDFGEDESYRKEPRLEGLNTYQRRLKKSSDFGRLEDALNNDSAEYVNRNVTVEPDLNTVAASKIQEFSSWLEEVRKPQHETLITCNSDNNEDLSVETKENNEINESFEKQTQMNAESLESSEKEIHTKNFVDDDSSSPIFNDINNVSIDNTAKILLGENLDSSENEMTNENVTSYNVLFNETLHVNTSTENLVENTPLNSTPSFSLSVNGMNFQDKSRNVVLISQPNSLEIDGFGAPNDETPPMLPTSPPPSTGLSYITEIQVTTPGSDVQSPPPLKAKPQRKDIPFETSRIPVRTMKSETGQKVLEAIHSMTTKDLTHSIFDNNKADTYSEDGAIPSVAGFYLKKVPPTVPPRRSETSPTWIDGVGKERMNGAPRPPIKTSATKIMFENLQNTHELS